MEVASCKSSNPGLWLFKKNFFQVSPRQHMHCLLKRFCFPAVGIEATHCLPLVGSIVIHIYMLLIGQLPQDSFLFVFVPPLKHGRILCVLPRLTFFYTFFFFLCVFLQFRVHLFQLAPLCASPPSVLLVPSSPASHMRIPACITWPCPHHSLFINFQSCCCTTQLKDHHKASCSFMPILVFR